MQVSSIAIAVLKIYLLIALDIDLEILEKDQKNLNPGFTFHEINRKYVNSNGLKSLLYSFLSEIDLYYNHLPISYVVPLTKDYNIKCPGYEYANHRMTERIIHNVDHLIHNWLLNHYEKTTNSTQAEIFYIPAYIADCYGGSVHGTNIPWVTLDKELHTFSDKVNSYNPDKAFISNTYPLYHPPKSLIGDIFLIFVI